MKAPGTPKIKVTTDAYSYMGLHKGTMVEVDSSVMRGNRITEVEFTLNGKRWTLDSDQFEIIPMFTYISPQLYEAEETNSRRVDGSEKKASVLDIQHGGSHYKDKGIQPIEYITANDLGFCEGNIVKYVSRHQDKNGAEDIRKVIHYAQFILKFQYNEDI